MTLSVSVNKKICIIGAGWYGCHLALALRKNGYDVTIYEKNPQIFSGVSGSYGIRLHSGLHYPRSDKTRENCRKGFVNFRERYPELVVDHEKAIYGLGTTDADGNPPKVTKEEFLRVAEELNGFFDWKEIDPESENLHELQTAIDLDEPSVLLGDPLRNAFVKYLSEAGVKVVCDFEVTGIEKSLTGKQTVRGKDSSADFDVVINSTGYQAHLPKDEDFPFDMEVVYQPCLALVYEDTQSGDKPISFIVMDGWFPCIMPVCEHETNHTANREYILTHGKWTIMGSFEDPANARRTLSRLYDEFVEANIKTPSEYEMSRFMPDFAERFRYKGWRGEVLAKLKTKKEFRSGFTYEKDGVIHVFPGKISNVFDVEDEVLALLNHENVLSQNGYSFIRGGVMDDSRIEIQEKPHPDEPNTANLQTFVQLIDEHAMCKEKYKAKQNIDPNANYFFEMQCLNRFFAGAAMLGSAMVALLYVSAMTVLPFVSAAVVMMGYSTYSFFSQSNRGMSREQLLPPPASPGTCGEDDFLEEFSVAQETPSVRPVFTSV